MSELINPYAATRLVVGAFLLLLLGCTGPTPQCSGLSRTAGCGELTEFNEATGELIAIHVAVCDGAYWRFRCTTSPEAYEPAEVPICDTDLNAYCSDGAGPPACLRIPCDGFEYVNPDVPMR